MTSTHRDTRHGHFATLVPDELVVRMVQFEVLNPEFRGVVVTTTLREAEGGSTVVVRHEGLPAAVSTADDEPGTRMALAKPATLLEAQ